MHKQQGADIINRYHAEVFAYRVYISITEIFAPGYRPLSRDRVSERVSGSVNYTLYKGIATAGSCRNPENRVAGSNARLPARSSVQSGSRRREFQRDSIAGRGPRVAFSRRRRLVCRLSPYLTRDALRSFIIGAQIIIRK